MGDIYRALADETRRAILDELVERDEQTLFELVNRLIAKHGLSSSRQAISQHLSVLEDAGLVRAEKRGRYRIHHLDTRPLSRIAERWPVRADAGRGSVPHPPAPGGDTSPTPNRDDADPAPRTTADPEPAPRKESS